MLLPNDAGVEYAWLSEARYRGANPSTFEHHRAIVVERDLDIAHCHKLLHDLPIALGNSETAMMLAVVAKPDDFNLLGSMVYQQQQICTEIASSKAKLAAFVAAPLTAPDTPPFTPLKMTASTTLKFGYNQFDGKLYNLIPSVNQATVTWKY